MGRTVDISDVLAELGLSAGATAEETAVATRALTGAEGAVRRYLGYDPSYQEHTELLPAGRINAQPTAGVWNVGADVAVLSELPTASNDQLQLTHLPIRSVTSLHVDYNARAGATPGAFAAGTLKVEGVDYWPNYTLVGSDGVGVCEDGIIRSFGLCWPSVPGAIKVVYYAGYKAAELLGTDLKLDASPIHEAALYEAVRRTLRYFANKKSRVGFTPGNVVSESLGDYSYALDSANAAGTTDGGDLAPDSKEKLASFRRMSYDL